MTTPLRQLERDASPQGSEKSAVSGALSFLGVGDLEAKKNRACQLIFVLWFALFSLASSALFPLVALGTEPGANGFKVGAARLHPSLGLSVRYDSYAIQLKRNEQAGDLILRVRPGVDLEVKGSKLDFSMNAKVAYSRYLGVWSNDSKDASYIGVDGGFTLDGKIAETLTLSLSDKLSRSNSTEAPTLQVGVLSLYNDAGLKLSWRPWGGTLRVEPSYHLASEVFTKRTDFDNLTCDNGFGCTGSDVSESNYLNHRAGLDMRWDFFPKSSLLFNGTYRNRTYLGANGVDLNIIDLTLGVSSLLLPRLTATVAFGWSYEFKNIHSSPLAKAALTYVLAPQSKLSLTYNRTQNPTPGLTWISYSRDRVALDAKLLFFGRLEVNTGVHANFLTYSSKSNGTYKNWSMGCRLEGIYAFLSWVNAGLSYDFTYEDKLAGIPHFTRHEVVLFGQIRY